MAVKLYLQVRENERRRPDDFLHRGKVAAVRRKTAIKELAQTEFDPVLRSAPKTSQEEAALIRLRNGFRLGGRPLTRAEVYM